MKKYILIGLAVIIGILLITNPSPEDFKAYIGKIVCICILFASFSGRRVGFAVKFILGFNQ